MRFPRADDVELTAAIRRYVVVGDGEIKRYLHLLGGDFTRTMSGGEQAVFLQAMHTAAREISDKELDVLLDNRGRSSERPVSVRELLSRCLLIKCVAGF